MGWALHVPHADADITALPNFTFPQTQHQHHQHYQQQQEEYGCGHQSTGSRLTVDDLVRCQQAGAAVWLTAADLRLYFYTIDYCL
jgi:hypothetical protein